MNRFHRTAAGLLLSAIFGLASSAHAAPKYTIHWYLGHPNLDYFEAAAASFKKAVEARSHGEIEVQIVTLETDASGDHSGAAASAPEIAAKVSKGEVEMGHSFTDVMSRLDPRLMAFEAPYLMRGYRHMEGVIEGPVGTELLQGLLPRNLIGLSFTYSGGASGVASVDREIRRPEDLKGLRVGVYGDPVNNAWLKSLGAVPVAIGHDLPSVLHKAQEGALDAVVITWRNFEVAKLDKTFKYFSLPGSTYLVSMTYINEKFFNGLPAEYQAMIKEESLQAARIERAKTIELNETAKRKMAGAGVRPVHLSEDAKASFAQALENAFEGPLQSLLGKGLIDQIRSTKDAPEHPAVPSDSGR